MKKYTIGLITGALLAVSAMMFIGAQNKNLGDVIVKSIKIENENGDIIDLKTEIGDWARDVVNAELDIADLEDDFNSNRRKTSQTLSEIQYAITLLQTNSGSPKGIAEVGKYQGFSAEHKSI